MEIKTYKIILIFNLLFILALHTVTYLLSDNRTSKIAILTILILLISYMNSIFLKKNKSKYRHFKLGLSILLFYEFSKYFAYKINILPNYQDVPFSISFLFTAFAIFIYIILLTGISKYLNK